MCPGLVFTGVLGRGLPRGATVPLGWVPWRLWGDSATRSLCSLGEAVSPLWASFFLPCVERSRNLHPRAPRSAWCWPAEPHAHLWGKCPTRPPPSLSLSVHSRHPQACLSQWGQCPSQGWKRTGQAGGVESGRADPLQPPLRSLPDQRPQDAALPRWGGVEGWAR